MQTFEEEGRRVLKKQRVCAEQIHRHLDLLLTEVETAKAQLEEKQDEYKRKRRGGQRNGTATLVERHAGDTSDTQRRAHVAEAGIVSTAGGGGGGDTTAAVAPSGAAASRGGHTTVEIADDEMEQIVQEFIERVRVLNLEKSIADELKGLHVALSKYGKQIDKLFSDDATQISRGRQPDHVAVCQLIAEYLYHDGQIAAADALCKEAEIELPGNYRECFVELHAMTAALAEKNMAPALEWARRHRQELQRLRIDIEFELLRVKYLDLVESCSNVKDAVDFASKELASFQISHRDTIGRLLSCALFKGKIDTSPYKDLFEPRRWQHVQEAVVRACCRLNRVPHRAYLDTCLSAGVAALPAMRKLVAVMDSKMGDWSTLEELPIDIQVSNEHRFHTVFACPVSKEESTPSNPPMLLKCGHVICKSCVKKISFNMSRRFKCPTCPVEQLGSETRELFF